MGVGREEEWGGGREGGREGEGSKRKKGSEIDNTVWQQTVIAYSYYSPTNNYQLITENNSNERIRKRLSITLVD